MENCVIQNGGQCHSMRWPHCGLVQTVVASKFRFAGRLVQLSLVRGLRCSHAEQAEGGVLLYIPSGVITW